MRRGGTHQISAAAAHSRQRVRSDPNAAGTADRAHQAGAEQYRRGFLSLHYAGAVYCPHSSAYHPAGTPGGDGRAGGAAGHSGHPLDGNGAQKAENMVVPAGSGPCGGGRRGAGYAGHGGLLRRRCADRVHLLLFSRAQVVVPAGAAGSAVLGQRGTAGRADVPYSALRHGL